MYICVYVFVCVDIFHLTASAVIWHFSIDANIFEDILEERNKLLQIVSQTFSNSILRIREGQKVLLFLTQLAGRKKWKITKNIAKDGLNWNFTVFIIFRINFYRGCPLSCKPLLISWISWAGIKGAKNWKLCSQKTFNWKLYLKNPKI